MTVNEKTLSPGTVLKGQHTYHIESVMGCGSFGITYKAYTLAETEVQLKGSLGNLSSIREEKVYVAIKEFFMSDFTGRDAESGAITGTGGDTLISQYRQKFKREAEYLSHLHHPNIVRVVEVFEANETVYYVMEFLEGGSLEQRINSSVALDEQMALGLMTQIGSAIDYLHKHKLLHLDLKPGNVMLTRGDKAVLIDFGLSKQYDANGAPESSTTIGGGTPGYSPIEQMSVRDFAPTLDIYAMAATLFKSVTGQRPHEAAILLSEGFPEQLLTAAGVSKSTIEAIRNGMNPVPAKRPQNVCSLLNALGLDGARVDSENKALLKQEKKGGGKAEAEVLPPEPENGPVQPEKPEVSKPSGQDDTTVNVDLTNPGPKSKTKPIIIGLCVGLLVFAGVWGCMMWLDGRKDKTTKSEEITPEGLEVTVYTVTDSAVVLGEDMDYTYSGEVSAKTKLPEGAGKAVYEDGTVYEGTFTDGHCTGPTVIKFSNGDTFKGTVESDIVREGRYTIKESGYYFEGTYDEQGSPLKGTWYDANGNVQQVL